MDRRAFSDLIGGIYDCAVDPALWPQILGQMCDGLGFRKATIDLNRVPGMTNVFNYHYGIDIAQAATMVGHYRAMPEVWGGLAAAMARPIARPWVVSRIITQDTLQRTDYYRDWVGPMGLVDGAAIILERESGFISSIRLATDARGGIIGDDLIDTLAELMPHCRRAAKVSGLLGASRTAAHHFEAVIDCSSIPIILLSASCTIVHANICARALLDQGAILAARHGRLISPIVGVERAIINMIGRITRNETDMSGSGDGLSVRGRDNAASVIHLLPLAKGSIRARLVEDTVAAIFVSGSPVPNPLAHDALQAEFKLTPAEKRVLELIFAGKGTREIAADLSIGITTVRTHVLHIFQKTHTSSRTDLVRLMYNFQTPITLDVSTRTRRPAAP